MLKTGLWIFSLLCETTALALLFLPLSPSLQLALFLLTHLAASYGFSLLLPARFSIGKKAGRLVLVFAFFVPVFGVLGMAASLLFFNQGRKGNKRSKYRSVPLWNYAPGKPRATTAMGEGGAWARLRAKELPWGRRVEALMAVDASSGAHASRLLQWAAGDGDDEIRLLAFHLHDGREKKLSSSINQALAKLKNTSSDRAKAELFSTLAFAYWELVYNELAEEELLRIYLEEALRCAQQAEALGGEGLSLSLLMARLHLRRKDIPRAEQAIEKALALGAPSDKAIPYQAELFYLRRDFDGLRALLAAAPRLGHKPGIGAVAAYWCEG
jgi:polysaccharide biosynthesis protein PelE